MFALQPCLILLNEALPKTFFSRKKRELILFEYHYK